MEITFLASFILMLLLTSRFDFTHILGLGHILWFPLLYFLWIRLGSIPAADFYGIWVRVLMAVNGISLVFDVTDVILTDEQIWAISASFPKINRKNRQMTTLIPIRCQ